MIIRARDNAVMIDLNFSVSLNTTGGELAIIRARGADAGTFLQGQLTQDVLLMNTSEARLAAWCSAKGRMLASFLVCKRSNDEFLLILSRDLLATTLKRLKMFVMRAKCELDDVTQQWQLNGLIGSKATDLLDAHYLIANIPYVAGGEGLNDSEFLITLPAGHHAGQAITRALQLCAQPALESVPSNVDAQQMAAWNALEISSGVARLSAAVSEAFVPQMLNYESAGGVNFKKGCYPGQEVVARSQFRGTLKRRGYIVTSDTALQAGQEVFDSREPGQPCGQIAQASPDPAGGFIAIVSMQTTAQDSPALTAGAPVGERGGAALQLQPLPYALLADV
jgi:tRNA-modifying protein YgfZ